MKVSPHTHSESPLSGSTLANLIARAKEMGRTHFAYTDHGHLSSAMKAYELCKPDKKEAKKAGREYMGRSLQFIPGLEIYFKDSSCNLVTGTKADRCKYFTGTLYCQTQEAYQALIKMISRTDFSTVEINEEIQQLWTWKDLEEISKFAVDFIAGGPHCMVGKCMLADEPQVAQNVFKKLHSIFKENLFVSLLVEPWTKKWNNVVEIKFADGTTKAVLAGDGVTTDKARNIKALDLTEKFHHAEIKSICVGNTYHEINKPFTSAKLHKGFLPLPGGDITLKINKLLLGLARRVGVNVLVTDYAYYSDKSDKLVQTMRMEGTNKLQPNLHMKTQQEVEDYLINVLKMNSELAIQSISENSRWAERYDRFSLKYIWHLADSGPEPLKQAMKIIKDTGRMKWDDPKYVARLQEELSVIAKNPKFDLTPYFLPIRDVLNFYKEQGFLTGPGRGSAGGSLFAYLLGIVQINPFKYDLPFQRFFSLERIMMGELPDIDVDLEDREPLVGADNHSGYLYGKYGNKAAQVSTRTTIRLKSAILDTNRYFKGKVEEPVSMLSKSLPPPPQGVSDLRFVFGYTDEEDAQHPGLIELNEDLAKYAEAKPEEWEIVSKAMGLTRAFSRHASAFVVADIPISDIVPTKDGNVTQYEAKACEAAGLIKYDFLVVTQLKDIRVCLDLINKKNGATKTVGYFDHKGVDTYIWDLMEETDVFHSIWGGEVATLFQINTKSMQPFVIDILPGSIMDLATILALVRPGPMDFINPATGRNMVEEYVLLRKGESTPDIAELAQLLPETFGVITFQEQLNKIARDLAGFPGERAEQLRKHMAKKNMEKLEDMKPDFIAGATLKVGPEIAASIWERMVTFGRYGFSVIHAVEYAHITYACMYLKHHYPMEWWAAVMTCAKEQEITGVLWPFVRDFVLPPDINLSGETMVVDYANEKIRSKLGVIRGIGENTIEPIVNGRPYASIQDFINKDVAGSSLSHKLIHVGVLDSLFPPKSSLLTKLKIFEDAVEVKKYQDKLAEAVKTGKKVRALQPREGVIPEEYINLPPLKDAAMKKSVLPSLPLDLHRIARKESKYIIDKNAAVPIVVDARGDKEYRSQLVNGEKLKRLDEMSSETLQKDVYVAATCFVIQAKEFAYSKNTKKALKLVLDCDGYVSEKVLWPEYETGKLSYPEGLKKGAIATVFFRKKVGRKPELNIMSVKLET